MQSLDLVLAQDAIAPIDLPPYANSAMDGYAIHSGVTARASHEHAVSLTIVGSVDAGEAWAGQVGSSQTVRIGTGAPIPDGCDAVVPYEQTVERGQFIEITAPVSPGKHIRPSGEDMRRGSLAVQRGTVLRPQEIGLLAALGFDSILTVPSPTVSILSIGPELFPSARPSPVNDSNGPMLAAQTRWAGGVVTRIEQCEGDPDGLAQLLDGLAAESDLIISSGGISNSRADTMTEQLGRMPGAELWNVRLRPGKHFGAATYKGCAILSLPGNPVAAFVGFELFGRRSIELLSGRPGAQPRLIARAAEPMVGTAGRTNALRGRLWSDPHGQLTVTPTEHRGSGILSSLPDANCLILLGEAAVNVERGDFVEIHRLG